MSAVTPNEKIDLDSLFSDLDSATGFAVAVSGGPDSLALLHLFHDWRLKREETRPVLVLTVDHGIRKEAAKECEFVCGVASRLGFESRVLRLPDKPSNHRQARNFRYRALLTAMAQSGLSHLLLGHHASDQAETVLHRLTSGSGLDGLAAMRRVSYRDGATLFRPLLALSPEQLRDVLIERRKNWIDDPSNRDTKHVRTRLRTWLTGLGDDGLTIRGLNALADRADRARDALEWAADNFFSDAVQVDRFGIARVERDALTALPMDLRVRVIRKILHTVRGIPPERLAQLEGLADRLTANDYSGETLNGCILEIVACELLVSREGRNLPSTQILPSSEACLWDDRFLITPPERPDGTWLIGSMGGLDPDFSDAAKALPAHLRRALPLFFKDGDPVCAFETGECHDRPIATFHGPRL